MKRDGGLDLLLGSDKEAAYNVLERLSEYGLFAVPRGELESWLRSLGASGKGPDWRIDVFQVSLAYAWTNACKVGRA
jgi:hypothetical protein